MSIPVALAGRLRGRRVVLGVRQHFPDYVRHRLPDSRWRLLGVEAADREELRDRVERTGAPVSLLGYVPFGPGPLDLYRRSDLFVHVARTEGLPQVLIEAQPPPR